MIGRRAIVGLCMLCALLVSAFAAQAASAATGTTGTAPAGVGYSGNIKGKGGQTLLHSVISGVEVELKSNSLTGTGSATSMVEGSEHTSNGTGVISYKEVTVVKPSGKGCEVVGKEVNTKELKATTAGVGMTLKFEPVTGGVFASFEVKGCTVTSLNGVYEVTGSVAGVPSEGTNKTVFERTPTTEQKTLKLRGQNAGIAGTLELETAGGEAINSSTVTTP